MTDEQNQKASGLSILNDGLGAGKTMELELKIYGSLCSTETFKINGVIADEDDFGEKHDHDSENAEDYGCGDMQFTRMAPKRDVLEKYCITEAEYAQVADQLESGLSFGRCGWCV
jgi:hypothetical protein